MVKSNNKKGYWNGTFFTDVSSDTLLEDYWEFYKKYSKRNILLSMILPIFGPLISLVDFNQFKKCYQKVKEMRKLEGKKADSLPVTMVYFEDEEKINKEKCMITGLIVFINKEEIIICPSCRRYAKKLLMKKWLKEKGSCPVCKESLNMQDCPMVMIKSRKK